MIKNLSSSQYNYLASSCGLSSFSYFSPCKRNSTSCLKVRNLTQVSLRFCNRSAHFSSAYVGVCHGGQHLETVQPTQTTLLLPSPSMTGLRTSLTSYTATSSLSKRNHGLGATALNKLCSLPTRMPIQRKKISRKSTLFKASMTGSHTDMT